MKRYLIGAAVIAFAAPLLTACGSEDSRQTVTLVAHDFFTPTAGIFDSFTAETGIKVNVVTAGDAGQMVAKATLTSGNPEGDVIWGVDNTMLSRAMAANVFDPYVSGAAPLDEDALAAGQQTVTPVDRGDVCVNYDVDYLESLGLETPTSLADLRDPIYKGLLVTEDPTASSPGFAFLLASVAEFGDRWSEYWTDLVANDVLVVTSWEDAYYTAFTKYGGDRPMVVSYSTSPPAEFVFADPPLPVGTPASTAIATGTCFRQYEFAGVLRGTKNVDAARRLVDFLVSDKFQSDLPLTQFVYPANTGTALPRVFTEYSPRIESPHQLSPSEIEAGREGWLETWNNIVSP